MLLFKNSAETLNGVLKNAKDRMETRYGNRIYLKRFPKNLYYKLWCMQQMGGPIILIPAISF